MNDYINEILLKKMETMKMEELITEAISEFIDVDIDKDMEHLSFMSKIEIVKKRLSDQIKNNPIRYGALGEKISFEYEMFFSSNPNDLIKIDGWIPIDTNRIEKLDKVDEYIEIGLLRKRNEAA